MSGDPGRRPPTATVAVGLLLLAALLAPPAPILPWAGGAVRSWMPEAGVDPLTLHLRYAGWLASFLAVAGAPGCCATASAGGVSLWRRKGAPGG